MIGFLLYFVFLFTERLLAVILSVNGGDFPLTQGNWFSIVTYAITVASFLAGTVILAKPLVKICAHMCKKNDTYNINEDLKQLVIGSTVLLVGGMLHTSFTIPVIQFVGYAGLIAGIICKCVDVCCSGGNKFNAIISAVYLTCMSMAIPVCYTYAGLPAGVDVAFYIVEFVTVALMVPMFGYLFYKQLTTGLTSKSVCPTAVTVVFAGAVMGLGWAATVNFFTLAFIGLTLISYIVLIIGWDK